MDDDNEMDIEDSDSSSVAMATGLNIEHPYAWALDGRLFGSGENSSQNNLQINVRRKWVVCCQSCIHPS